MEAALSKEDAAQVVRSRRGSVPASFWQQSTAAAVAELGELSDDDWTAIKKAQKLRADAETMLGPQTIESLNSEFKSLRISKPKGITRGGMIDVLMETKKVRVHIAAAAAAVDSDTNAADTAAADSDTDAADSAAAAAADTAAAAGDTAAAAADTAAAHLDGPIALDEEQEAAASRWNDPLLMINAGPGSGKTRTLVELVARAAAAPRARVLVLAFNVCAEKTFEERLKGRCRFIWKTEVETTRGVAVLTFNKLAYRLCAAHGINPRGLSYDQQVEAGGRVAAAGFGPWDLVVVDEAQDVTAAHAALVEGVAGAAGARLVIAGDPRQELYPGADWFTRRWIACPEGARAVLRRNYRSTPAVVRMLNEFSRAAFPRLHIDQVAARPAAGEPPAVVVDWVKDSHHYDAVNVAIGERVGHRLAAEAPGAAYALAVVSVDCYGGGQVCAAARQVVVEKRPTAYAEVVKSGAARDSGAAYTLSTVKIMKGTEKDVVVLFGADQAYQNVDPVSIVKNIYVGLSRARRQVVLLLRSRPGAVHPCLAALVPAEPARFRGLPAHEEPPRYQETISITTGVNLDNGLCGVKGLPSVVLAAVVTGEAAAEPEPEPEPAAAEPAAAAAEPTATVELTDDEPVVSFDFESALSGTSAPEPEARVELGESQGDRDFMGLYVEALLAEALGVPLFSLANVVPKEAPVESGNKKYQKSSLRIYYDMYEGHYVLEYGGCKFEAVKTLLDTLNGPSNAYTHATFMMSVQAGRPWTVSKRLQNDRAAVQASAAICAWLRTALGIAASAQVVYQRRFREPLSVDRYHRPLLRELPAAPAKDTGAAFAAHYSTEYARAHRESVVGIVDFSVDDRALVEVKYVDELSDQHRRQAAIYATMAGHEKCLLLNARRGTAEWVASFDARLLRGVARACLAFNNCKITNNHRAYKAIFGGAAAAAPPPAADARPFRDRLVVIALDIETAPRGKGEPSRVTEIGAVAFSPITGDVVGTYREVAPGVAPLAGPPRRHPPQDRIVEGLTRLTVRDRAALADGQAGLRARFLAWAAALSAAPCYLHWGGSDREVTGDAEAADLMRAYRDWLAAGGAPPRAGCRLADAVARLAPSLQWEPHRAFEDALATAAVYMAMAPGGVL